MNTDYCRRLLGQQHTDTTRGQWLHAIADPAIDTYVRLGMHGKGGYVVALPDEDGWAEVVWDNSTGWRDLVEARRLFVPVDGPDYRPAHMKAADAR